MVGIWHTSITTSLFKNKFWFKVILHQFWVKTILPWKFMWNTVVPLLSYSCMFQVEICSQQLEICKSVCMFFVFAIIVETRRWKWWSPLAIYSAITNIGGAYVCIVLDKWVCQTFIYGYIVTKYGCNSLKYIFAGRFVLFYIQHTSSCRNLDVK